MIPGSARPPFSTRETIDAAVEHLLRARADTREDALCVLDRAVLQLDVHRVAAQPRFQLGRGPLDDDLALRDDGEPVGQLVGFLEVVRGEEDRQRLCLREPRNLVPHRDARLRVEPRRRLVEEEHARAVHQAERDVEAAAHPARVVLDDAVGGVRDADELEQLGGARSEVAPAHPLDAALQHQVLAAGAELVDAGVLWHVADRTPYGVLLGAHVMAGDRRAAFVGVGQRHEDANGGRLAGAVRPEQPEHLALAHLERDAVERLHLGVALP